MTTTPDRTTRETRRRHIDRLIGKADRTASERVLLGRLRRLEADDPSPAGDDRALRSALGLPPEPTPAATRTPVRNPR